MLPAIITLLIVLLVAAVVLMIAWLGARSRARLSQRWMAWGKKAADFVSGEAQIPEAVGAASLLGLGEH